MTIDTVLLFNAEAEPYAQALAARWKNRQATCCRTPAEGASVTFGQHVLLAGVISAGPGDPGMEARLADLVAERAGSAIVIALPGAVAPRRIVEANIPVIETPGDPASDGEHLDVALRELDRLAIFSADLKWRRSSLSRLRTPREVETSVAAAREDRRRAREERQDEEFLRRDRAFGASRLDAGAPAPLVSARVLGYFVGALLGCGMVAGGIWWALAVLQSS